MQTPYFDEFHPTYQVKIALMPHDWMFSFFMAARMLHQDEAQEDYILDVKTFDPENAWDIDETDAVDVSMAEHVNAVMAEALFIGLHYVWWKGS